MVGITLTVLIPSTPQGSHHSTIIRISSSLVGLEGELVGSCPCGSELGPASGTNSCVFSLHCIEMHLLLALTSWELT